MKSTTITNVICAALLAGLMACGEKPAPQSAAQTEPAATTSANEPIRVAEAFVTPSKPKDNVDSIGIFQHEDGNYWAVITAKEGDKLVVFDAVTGTWIKDVGSEGTAPGQLNRPNGVLVLDDLCFVIERDNHRVQVFRLPEFEHVGFIGSDHLIKPYGGSVFKDQDGSMTLYVTDDYEKPAGELPADFYTKRIKMFRVAVENGQLNAQLVKSFGDAEGLGRLFKVETIWADPANNRLFIADEKGASKGIKIYDIEGNFSGRMLKTVDFVGEPEGVAIYEQADGNGYLVTTDQQPNITVFHIFDRKTLNHLGQFAGNTTTNTDGIAVSSKPMGAFQAGGLWAIHDDQALSGFSWADIHAAILKK